MKKINTIYETKEFTKFLKIKGNREIKQSHIDYFVKEIKENGQQTSNGWRLTVNDSVISGKKHSSNWATKADAVAKAYRLANEGLLEDAIAKLDKAFPEFKNK